MLEAYPGLREDFRVEYSGNRFDNPPLKPVDEGQAVISAAGFPDPTEKEPYHIYGIPGLYGEPMTAGTKVPDGAFIRTPSESRTQYMPIACADQRMGGVREQSVGVYVQMLDKWYLRKLKHYSKALMFADRGTWEGHEVAKQVVKVGPDNYAVEGSKGNTVLGGLQRATRRDLTQGLAVSFNNSRDGDPIVYIDDLSLLEGNTL